MMRPICVTKRWTNLCILCRQILKNFITTKPSTKFRARQAIPRVFYVLLIAKVLIHRSAWYVQGHMCSAHQNASYRGICDRHKSQPKPQQMFRCQGTNGRTEDVLQMKRHALRDGSHQRRVRCRQDGDHKASALVVVSAGACNT